MCRTRFLSSFNLVLQYFKLELLKVLFFLTHQKSLPRCKRLRNDELRANIHGMNMNSFVAYF